MIDREPYRPGLVRNQNLVQQLKELQRNPRSLVFVSLAELYRSEGLPHQALEILEEGLGHHRGLASAVLSKARCLFDLRRFGEAAAVCREILRSNPNNIKAHKLLADVFVRLGQRKAAIRSLTRVVSLFPQDGEAVRALEELENLEASTIIPPARITARASVDSPPRPPGRISDFQVESFGESLAAIPSLESVPKEIAHEQDEVEAGETDEVERDGPEPTFATRTIAELYLRQGLKGKAERVLRKILQEDPANPWARETLQDLGSDEIVLPAQQPQFQARRAALKAQARALERLLAQVRLRKPRGA